MDLTICETTAEAEILSLLPAEGAPPVGVHPLERLDGIPELYSEVMVVIGTFLGLAPSQQGGGLAESTLRAVHSSAKHLYKASLAVSLHSLSHAKTEKLHEAMSRPLPVPGAEGYFGFADSRTMSSLGLDVLGIFMKLVEKTIERDCSELWLRVAKTKLAALREVMQHTEEYRDTLEGEYAQAHKLLVKYKRTQDAKAELLKSEISALRATPAPLNFECELDDPTPTHKKIFAAAYLVLCPPREYTETPAWQEILVTVLGPSRSTFSYCILSDRTLRGIIYEKTRTCLLFEIMGGITKMGVMKVGSQALEAVYDWLVAAVGYLGHLDSMLPVQDRIRGHSRELAVWEEQMLRCKESYAVVSKVCGDVPRQEEAVEEVERHVDLAEVHRQVVATIEGWGDYDTSEVLTTTTITKLFNECDIDGNGYLDHSELHLMNSCLERFGVPHDASLNEFIATYSTPAKGLSLNAFAMFMLKIAAR